MQDILIIGAGAAGLLAARELRREGKTVTILEARDRTGGRIHTLPDQAFDLPVETGAEFVHGKLPITLKLLREAGIPYYAATGDFLRVKNGRLEEQDDMIEHEKLMVKRLKQLPNDISVHEFLHTYFPGPEYEEMRASVTSYTQGYEAADITQASSFALLQGLVDQDPDNFRIRGGGYGALVKFLENQCVQEGCRLHLSSVVTSINWRPGEVTVNTQSGGSFTAKQVIITLPVAVLQAMPGESGHVFIGSLPDDTREAINALGTTGVIKTILQFNEPFWNNKSLTTISNASTEPGFIFSDTLVPTWWTQLPDKNGMITGWLAGPASLPLRDATDEYMLEQALQSLSEIFLTDISILKNGLVGWHVKNWTADPFTKGAYAYERVTSKSAKRILNTPISNTIFFAGEGLCEGPERGTVEAAFISALDTVEKMV
jgi:monoamine oxidase